jgi:uncharacterized protein (TIGR00297 family)
LGLVFSSLIGFGGYYKKALSKSGLVGAILVGTIIFGFGGWAWGLVLIAFFVSSSLLSSFKESNKASVAEKFEKGHRRDLGQTLANGGAGAIAALMSVVWPAGWCWWAFLGALATVNADTWATELGILSKRSPRLITTGKQVSPGISGGITPEGTLASLVGGMFIGVGGWLLAGFGQAGLILGPKLPPAWFVLLAGIAGLLGALFDSLLGATWQAMYYCPACAKETEQKHHRTCGHTPTQPLRGIGWLNNDMVNFVSAIFGAIVAVAIGLTLETFIQP